MRKGLTPSINNIIEAVSTLNSIKDYVLCCGTSLAIQLVHRQSEDLDFMAWRVSKDRKPEVDWPTISKELEEKVGHIDNMDLLGFDQVIFLVRGVKISFYVSDKLAPAMTTLVYLGNIKLASIEAILAMKLEVMLRRMKFRDYYDVYSIIKKRRHHTWDRFSHQIFTVQTQKEKHRDNASVRPIQQRHKLRTIQSGL